MLSLQVLRSPQRPVSCQQTSQMVSGRWSCHVRMEWSMTSSTEEITFSLRSGTQIDLTLRFLLHLWPTLPRLRYLECSRWLSIARNNVLCPCSISGAACHSILAHWQALCGGTTSWMIETATTSSWELLLPFRLLCFCLQHLSLLPCFLCLHCG